LVETLDVENAEVQGATSSVYLDRAMGQGELLVVRWLSKHEC